MRSLVPYIHLARDARSGRLIRAERAEVGAGRGRYRCLDPACDRDVAVVKSKLGRQFFRHFRSRERSDCVLISRRQGRSRHGAAQLLLCLVLQEGLDRRAPMPVLQFLTPAGVCRAIPMLIGQRVVAEWTCPTTGRRADVAVLDREGEPVLLVEVFHTHAVDRNKRSDLGRYWWIEVGAEEFLEMPTVLNVLASGNLPYDYEVLGNQAELFSEE